MSRPQHPKPHLEAVLKEAEDKGWRVTRGKKYFMIWCPCPKRHKKTVKISPRGKYLTNLIGELNRATCWGKADES